MSIIPEVDTLATPETFRAAPFTMDLVSLTALGAVMAIVIVLVLMELARE